MTQQQPGMGVQSAGGQQHTGRRILGNALLLLLMLTVAASVATQYIAHQFQYAEQLGQPLYDFWYQPWRWVAWAWHYRRHYTGVIDGGLMVFMIGMTVSMLIFAFTRVLIRSRNKGVEGLHGTARFAQRRDIVEAGLLQAKPRYKKAKPNKGVYVGAWHNPLTQEIEYLQHDGAEHLLLFAPTGAGKGVGIVLPTLLSYTESAIVYDLKGENYHLTAGWRAKHANNIILKFDPTDPVDCSRFNPLAEIRLKTDFDVPDAQNIANTLVDPHGKGLNDHFTKKAFELMTMLILHACYASEAEGRAATLADIDTVLTTLPDEDEAGEDEDPLDQVFEAIRDFPHRNGQPHELVAKVAQAMILTPARERGSIISTTTSFLSLYNDPVVRKSVSASDWKIEDLMNSDQPVTLYLVIPPNSRDRLLPLIRLMITLITQRLTDKMSYKDGRSVQHYNFRMLMLLDEFASMKRLTAVEDALSFSRSFGVRFFLIVQDTDQLTKPDMYGRENGIMGNCKIKIAYAPDNYNTAETLSKMTGVSTVIKEAITESGKRHSWIMSSASRSFTEHQRPLMTADEVTRMPKPVIQDGKVTDPGQMLIISSGTPPILGVPILYFMDSVFLERADYASNKVPGAGHTQEVPKTINLDDFAPSNEVEAINMADFGRKPDPAEPEFPESVAALDTPEPELER